MKNLLNRKVRISNSLELKVCKRWMKKESYSITPIQFFEMMNIHDIVALKAVVENRLSDVEKVSNISKGS